MSSFHHRSLGAGRPVPGWRKSVFVAVMSQPGSSRHGRWRRTPVSERKRRGAGEARGEVHPVEQEAERDGPARGHSERMEEQ